MSGSSESWKRGRVFEEEIDKLLPLFFNDVDPIYKKGNKYKWDFLAKEKDGREVKIECKSSMHGDYSMNISLQQKDLESDYLFLKFGNKVYIFSKFKEIEDFQKTLKQIKKLN